MGKKRLRKKLTSEGKHSSINRALATKIRAEQRAIHGHGYLIDAWKNLKNPWLTIENPSKEQTNRRFIRVRANSYWGDPRPPREKERLVAQ